MICEATEEHGPHLATIEHELETDVFFWVHVVVDPDGFETIVRGLRSGVCINRGEGPLKSFSDYEIVVDDWISENDLYLCDTAIEHYHKGWTKPILTELVESPERILLNQFVRAVKQRVRNVRGIGTAINVIDQVYGELQ